MAIFTERNGRYNFVDENDIFVGFNASQCCCESFGFKITLGEDVVAGHDDEPSDVNKILDGLFFDTTFCKEELDDYCGGDVTFRLEGNGKVVYLELYNRHNGYYSHGFEMAQGTKVIFNGSI